jgi:multimeric flavodoxin WrbA
MVVFNGSPRGEDGNTHRIVVEFAAGAEQAGAEVRVIFLVEHEIRHCTACRSCWVKTPGQCVIPDDMANLLEEIRQADIAVFATPLYVDNVSGLMKVFMDRSIPLMDPHFELDSSGEYAHPSRVQSPPKLVVIANAGLPEQSQFQVLRLLSRRVARNFRTDLIAEIYRGAGEILGSRNRHVQPILENYSALLRQAGKEVVEDGRLSGKTTAALDQPLVEADRYIRGANLYWDRELARESRS